MCYCFVCDSGFIFKVDSSFIGYLIDFYFLFLFVRRAAADQVLTRDIPWDGYQKANMITDKELDLIRKFDKKSEETKRSLLAKVKLILPNLRIYIKSRKVMLTLNYS